MNDERPPPASAPEGEPAAPQPEMAPAVPFFKRRWPKLILFLGMMGIIIHLFQSQPVLVEVTYEYGAGRRGLQTARMRYMQDGTEARWIIFDYRRTPAGTRQKHQARLLKGDYVVEVELTYSGHPPAAIHGQRVPRSGKEVTVLLERPLLVRGEGEVSVTIAE